MQTAPLPAAVMVPSFLKFPDETLLIVYDLKRSLAMTMNINTSNGIRLSVSHFFQFLRLFLVCCNAYTCNPRFREPSTVRSFTSLLL